MPKRPDRLERLVYNLLPDKGCVQGLMWKPEAMMLLRRERARLKRRVKGLPTVETTDLRKKILSVWVKLDDVLRVLEE